MLRHHFVTALAALAVLASAELATLAAEDRLGEPTSWPSLAIQRKVEQIRDLEPVDLVIVGSSAAAEGVDPTRITAAATSINSAYNAAFPYGGPGVSREFFESVVEPQLNPSVVIVELLPHATLDVPDEAFGTAFAKTLEALNQPSPNRALDSSALFRNRSTLANPFDALRRLLYPAGADLGIDPAGFVSRSRSDGYHRPTDAGVPLAVNALAEVDLPLAAQDIAALVESIEQAGARAVLVVMPVYEPDFYGSQAELRQLWTGFVDELRSRGVLVVDTTAALSWPIEYFADPVHLNEQGSDRLSAWIGNQLDMLGASEDWSGAG